jgi:hypothetical protein
MYEGPSRGPSRTASPLSQVVNVPQVRETAAMRPNTLEEEGPKLSTFKPPEEHYNQPEFTPEGIIWTPQGDSSTLPRSYQMAPMVPTMSVSMDERLPPFPPTHCSCKSRNKNKNLFENEIANLHFHIKIFFFRVLVGFWFLYSQNFAWSWLRVILQSSRELVRALLYKTAHRVEQRRELEAVDCKRKMNVNSSWI